MIAVKNVKRTANIQQNIQNSIDKKYSLNEVCYFFGTILANTDVNIAPKYVSLNTTQLNFSMITTFICN